MKWEKFQMLHAVFVLAKLNAKWGGMIKSLVSRVGSVVGDHNLSGYAIYQKGFPLHTHTHTHLSTSKMREKGA